MSRETLLDDAIAKAKEAEDWQLVEWLRMARGGESATRWYTAKLGEARLDMSKLMTENAKLRELVRDLWEACPVDGYYCIYHCEHYDKESESHCKLEDRMRELGVQVNTDE